MTTAVLADLQQRIEQLTPAEKVELMEVLWQGLARNEASYRSPEWHTRALEKAERLVAEGGATFSDWTEARERLKARLQQKP